MNLSDVVSASSRYEPRRKGLIPAMHAPGASGSNVKSGVGRSGAVGMQSSWRDHRTRAAMGRCWSSGRMCSLSPVHHRDVTTGHGPEQDCQRRRCALLYPILLSTIDIATHDHANGPGCFWSGSVTPIDGRAPCPVPGLMEALNPRGDESHDGTEEVPRRTAGAGNPDGSRCPA